MPEDEDEEDKDQDLQETGGNTEADTKKKKLRKIDDEEEDDNKKITRGRMGIMLPDKNAFDFVVRVENQEVFIKDKKKDESGKSKL